MSAVIRPSCLSGLWRMPSQIKNPGFPGSKLKAILSDKKERVVHNRNVYKTTCPIPRRNEVMYTDAYLCMLHSRMSKDGNFYRFDDVRISLQKFP